MIPTTSPESSTSPTEIVSTAKDHASSIADASKDEVKTLARDAKSHAEGVLAQSRDQLRMQADEQLHNVAGTLSDIGRQLSNMAQGQPQAGPVVDVTHDVAASVARFGERLEQGGVEGTMQEARRFARQRPGVFLLASLGAGMVVGRVLRSADQRALLDAAKPRHDRESDEAPAEQLDLTQGF
jgi:hypothetical protein